MWMSVLSSHLQTHTCIINTSRVHFKVLLVSVMIKDWVSRLPKLINIYTRTGLPARSGTKVSPRGTFLLSDTPAATGCFVPQTVPAVFCCAISPEATPADALLRDIMLGGVTVVFHNCTLAAAWLVFSNVGSHNPGQGDKAQGYNVCLLSHLSVLLIVLTRMRSRRMFSLLVGWQERSGWEQQPEQRATLVQSG